MANEPNSPNPPAGTPPAGTPPAQPQGGDPNAGITPAQLHLSIEKARLEEREKLRNRIDEAEAKALNLATEAEASKKQLTDIKTQFDAIKAGMKPEGGVDVQKAIEQAVAAASASINKQYGVQLEELNKQLNTERTERQKLAAERLREKLIAEAGGVTALIPELVRGSNEEELKASIEASKQVFQRTVASAGAPAAPSSQQGSNGNPGAAAVPPSIPNAGGSQMSGGTGNPVNVRALSMKEYAEQREKLKKAAAARYPRSVVMQ